MRCWSRCDGDCNSCAVRLAQGDNELPNKGRLSAALAHDDWQMCKHAACSDTCRGTAGSHLPLKVFEHRRLGLGHGCSIGRPCLVVKAQQVQNAMHQQDAHLI